MPVLAVQRRKIMQLTVIPIAAMPIVTPAVMFAPLPTTIRRNGARTAQTIGMNVTSATTSKMLQLTRLPMLVTQIATPAAISVLLPIIG